MPPIRLTPLPDGPYEVAGELDLVTHDGRTTPITQSPIYLCRCGHSGNKPFCDGSHARIGWKDDA